MATEETETLEEFLRARLQLVDVDLLQEYAKFSRLYTYDIGIVLVRQATVNETQQNYVKGALIASILYLLRHRTVVGHPDDRKS